MLGAIRARLAAMTQRNELLRLAGLLPYSPRDTYVEADFRNMSDPLTRGLHAHEAGDEIADDRIVALEQLHARTDGHLASERQPPLLGRNGAPRTWQRRHDRPLSPGARASAIAFRDAFGTESSRGPS